ncbi:MAG: ORF6N domain-containing protein, partial [Desulfamplus sp.]|nr:ORF6N domain-containing protein [Desulfamplus sp.]
MSALVSLEDIQKKIFSLRGMQIMLDGDIASLYEVETRVLNQAVKRNSERFPAEFMFQLDESDLENLRSQSVTSSDNSLRSQIVTLNKGRGQHRKYLPYAFTEQGVAMLSSVLKSETAVKISIQIMNAFVAMRRFLQTNAQVFQRLDTLEIKQIQTDQKIDQILSALEYKSVQPKQGIFYDGQVFDAYQFVSDLIRSAEKSILLIDNYLDDTVLLHLSKRKAGVKVRLLTKTISPQLALDIKKYNEQYPSVEIQEFKNAHDRFMI